MATTSTTPGGEIPPGDARPKKHLLLNITPFLRSALRDPALFRPNPHSLRGEGNSKRSLVSPYEHHSISWRCGAARAPTAGAGGCFADGKMNSRRGPKGRRKPCRFALFSTRRGRVNVIWRLLLCRHSRRNEIKKSQPQRCRRQRKLGNLGDATPASPHSEEPGRKRTTLFDKAERDRGC